jgi:hypothetical protein
MVKRKKVTYTSEDGKVTFIKPSKKPEKKVCEWDTKKISNEESKKWYDLAAKQNFDTLTDFIQKVREEFPGYTELPEGMTRDEFFKNMTNEQQKAVIDEQKVRYINGIFAGILISYAAFHATSNTYGYSCNQAG